MKKSLKLTLLIALCFGMFALAGCEKDKEKEKENKPETEEKEAASIEGTWENVDEEGGYTLIYVFKEDGTGTYETLLGETTEKQNFTYRISDNAVYIIYEGDEDEYENKYEIKDGKLILEDSFEEKTTYVKK